jgi:hypothetical protein
VTYEPEFLLFGLSLLLLLTGTVFRAMEMMTKDERRAYRNNLLSAGFTLAAVVPAAATGESAGYFVALMWFIFGTTTLMQGRKPAKAPVDEGAAALQAEIDRQHALELERKRLGTDRLQKLDELSDVLDVPRMPRMPEQNQ